MGHLRNASKKTKTRLLNEARRRTRLNREVLIGKLAHPAAKSEEETGPRKPVYDSAVKTVLIELWEILDYPSEQRLRAALRREVERLRESKEVQR